VPVEEATAGAVLYGLLFVVALTLSLGPYGAAQEFYDRYGIGERSP
jgi:hypothetical protein